MLTDAGAREIAEAFTLGPAQDVRGPVARGEIGQIWRLDTADGSFAVKEWFEDPPTEAELAEGACFQEAAAAAGVPSPVIVRRPDGALLFDLEDGPVRVFAWVDLRDRDAGIDAGAVGTLLATLHRVPFAGTEPMDPWYAEPVGAERWRQLARELVDRGAPFAGRMDDFRGELEALEALIVPPSNLRTCHRDLWADNLRATPAGELCLIDWDDAGLGDPGQELALVLFEFARRNPARARSLADAYTVAGGPGRVRSAHDFTMPIAQLGHIGERSCQMWLDASDEVARHRAATMVREFADDALTRDVIDELLAAVAE